MLDEPAVRPEGFDLTSAWQSITKDVDEWRSPATARAIVEPETLSLLRWAFGRRVRVGPPGTNGKVQVEPRGTNTHALAREIAGFGQSVDVLEPEEIREYLAEIGRELGDLYGPAPALGAVVE